MRKNIFVCNKNTDVWGRLSLFIYCLVVLIGENIEIRFFNVEYTIYLNLLYLSSIPILLFRFRNIEQGKGISFFYLFTVFVFFFSFFIKNKGITFPKMVLSPFLLFLCIPKRQKCWKTIANLLILFFLLNSIIAIFEKTTETFVVGFVDPNMDYARDFSDDFGGKGSFRSTAMLGHPLQNALMTTIVMTFVLFSNIKNVYKLAYWFVCFIAIACFNARAAIVLNILVLCIFTIRTTVFTSHKSILRWILNLSLIITIMFTIHYLYNNTNMGDRLKLMGITEGDGSVEARFSALSMLSILDWHSVLIGISGELRENLMNESGVHVIENYWIGMIVYYGLIIVLLYAIVLFVFAKYYYESYPIKNVIITAGTYLFLSSTNNSLMWTYVPTFIFFLCIYIFNPQNISTLIPSYAISTARKKTP